MSYCGVDNVPTLWRDREIWLQNRPWSSRFHKDLLLLAVSVAMFSVWWERNIRLFGHQSRGHQASSLYVKNMIRVYVGEWRGVTNSCSNWVRCVEMGLVYLFLEKLLDNTLENGGRYSAYSES